MMVRLILVLFFHSSSTFSELVINLFLLLFIFGPDWSGMSEELISMCEYLGIRVLSERDMIWIAEDALKAPLPVNWMAQRDRQGRTFFYNNITQQSRWEHPLDPHFRNLRDKYRQR
jgi:hypothetical protein